MSYEFTSDEPVAVAVRRIVREEAGLAAQRLRGRSVRERDEAIHEVRKGVKRVRGLLRLIQPALGDAYIEEAQTWRDLGRRLSAWRDAGAVLETLEELRQLCPAPLYGSIRRRLSEGKRQLEQPGKVAGTLAKVSAQLGRAEKRVDRWPLDGDGFAAIAPGLQQTYRRGVRAWRLSKVDPSAENLHNLRKRAKEHLFQVRLLRPLWDSKLRRHEARVRRLEELLGSHQNLAVLKSRIFAQRAALAPAEDLERFLVILDQAVQDLPGKALKLGARVYQEPSEQVAKRVKRLWERWQDS